MLPNPIKVAIVDDHILFRKTLVSFLNHQDALNVIFDSSDIAEFINKPINSVDILITNIFLPQLIDEPELNIVRNRYPGIKVILLSICTDIPTINELLNIGIHAIISKADEPDELLKAIKSASANRIYRNKSFTDALYWGTQNNINTNHRKTAVTLDDREKTIIQLLWEEKNNKEIADHLYLSVRSIEKIRQDIKEKLGAKSTIGVFKYALSQKIILLNGESTGYTPNPVLTGRNEILR